ncbi:hypothetical protein [Gordonia hankookensis]|uniref:Transmembrane protein n=1 Tax=Gordonia hankookensis TaxID=589403 RepID=A0ABR7WFH4_9ACTN|nr:hypothetical protein [Gordonia hankookensis]MBD1321316.1 hypothetical protein [Gordonia hankookensis]
MLSRGTVSSVAIALILIQLVVRGWLAATGNFYWDDLVLIGRASTLPILSWDYLGHSHDGHFMPAAFLLAGLSTVIAPVNWLVPAISMIVLQAIASLSVWRMIRVIAGPRAGVAALAALTFYLFSPMTVPAFAWWAAALNTLPMQAAMAWIVADAVLLTRSRGRRPDARMIVIRSSVVFVIALTFFEKSLFILPVAFVAAVLAARFTGRPDDDAPPEIDSEGDAGAARPDSALIRAFTGARALWASLGVVFVAWAVVFFSVSDATAGQHSATQTMRLVWRSINDAVIPSLVGGPWEWERWVPSPPMGFPPVWMIVLGWVVLAALVWWAITRRRGAGAVLLCTAVYVVGAQIPVLWNRSSANTALELAQTMRYLPDAALVITIAIALIVASPATAPGEAARHGGATEARRLAPVIVPLAGALAVVSAVISLVSFSTSWRDDPTGDYLANAKRSLAANRDHPMFDQSLPLEVLLPVAYPNNQISHTFGRVRDRPDFAATTDRLNVLDNAGNMVPGAVTPARTVRPGRGSCSRPEVTGPRRLVLDGPLLQWRWTVAVSYCADMDGDVDMALDGGRTVRVPVRAGLHVAYVQLEGRGRHVDVRPVTPGLTLHTGEGRVGEVAEARLVG